MFDRRPRIIDVERKPIKCPVCKSRVVDIIYGTGDMTEVEFFLKYRREGMMGGDNIPRRPPIWECVCGCKRFRKVNPDGTDAPVKVKMLKNIRKAPAELINWTTSLASQAVTNHNQEALHHYKVDIETELGEKEQLSITAVNKHDARGEAIELVANDRLGLEGIRCVSIEVHEE